ncbi:DUF4373 domain-containing protein [Bacteroides faecium]|uniref:DUF4373 domain-containing protein n=1 Tax=Bacteroides faecium TaxID=2715212 RepID=A0A6H0KRM6_9BACE|nr:DUF4373 domain-containing protein [Bacteroides faecium]QIU96126.1 DUF4373 domain-containing protein [Bacteroides faecium]
MSMINKGISYFPTPANFFDEEVMELLEAKFGVLASYIVLRLLCKIYKEGYYISWGKEQSLIFVRKVGGGINKEMMEKIMELLLEKGFFHKETYEQYGVLTSERIQEVWFEATTRRKIDFSQLPYILENKKKKGKRKDDVNEENADISSTQEDANPENEDISGQTKLKQTKLNLEEEEISDASFEIPGYAYNQATHNMNGLIESLERHKVTNPKERQTILRLSDYGRKGTQVWKLLSNTSWNKIGAPGKYIIAALAGGRKQAG